MANSNSGKVTSLYGSAINSIYSSSDKTDIIDAKYQLPADVQEDFNSAIKFLSMASLKSNTEMLNNETSLSTNFGNLLLKYFNNEFANSDILSILNIVNDVHDAVQTKYNIGTSSDISTIKKQISDVINDFFGMELSSTGTISIVSGSYADKLYTNISNVYKYACGSTANGTVQSTDTAGTTTTTTVTIPSPKASLNNYDVQIIKLFEYYLIVNALIPTTASSISCSNPTDLPVVKVCLDSDHDLSIATLRKNSYSDAVRVKTLHSGASSLSDIVLHTFAWRFNSVNPLYISGSSYSCCAAPSIPVDLYTVSDKILTSVVYSSALSSSSLFVSPNLGVVAEQIYWYSGKNADGTDKFVTDTSNVPSGYKLSTSTANQGIFTSVDAANTSLAAFGVILRAGKIDSSRNVVSGVSDSATYIANSTASGTSIGFYPLNTKTIQISILEKSRVSGSSTVSYNGYNTLSSLMDTYASANGAGSASYFSIPSGTFAVYYNGVGPYSEYTIPDTTDNSSFISAIANIKNIVNNSINEVSTESSTIIKSKEIRVKVNQANTFSASEPITYYYGDEKRTASGNESYWMEQRRDPLFFVLQNVILDTSKTVDSQIKTLLDTIITWSGGSASSVTSYKYGAKTYYRFSISILYKEFNPYVRNLTLGNIEDSLLSAFISANTISISTDMYNVIDESALPANSDVSSDEFTLFKNIRTNPFIVRSVKDCDIASYYVGSTSGVGSTSKDIRNVESLLKCFSETRDYYYRTVRDDAFTNQKAYPLYEKMMISVVAVEKYISGKAYHVKSLNDLGSEDCKNYLISYGLEELYNQIQTENFSNSLDYEKRIIASYTDLMGLKGSKAVIDKLLSIFDYSGNDIQVYRYVIYNNVTIENNAPVYETKFIPIPYDTTTTSYYIKNNAAAEAVDYASFISDDNTWTTTEVPMSVLTDPTSDDFISSPQSTKYLKLKLKKDVFSDFVTTQYAASIMSYMSERFLSSADKKTMSQIKVTTDLLGSSEELSLAEISNIVELLFLIYVYQSSVKSGYNNGTKPEKPKYYGINFSHKTSPTKDTTDPTIANVTLSSLSQIDSLVKSCFNSPIARFSYTDGAFTAAVGTETNDQIFIDEPVSIGAGVKSLTNLSFVDGNSVDPSITPVLFPKISSSYTGTELYKNMAWDYLVDNVCERFTDINQVLVYDSEDDNKSYYAVKALKDSMSSVNYLNLINSYYNESATSFDDAKKKKYYNDLHALYYYYQYQDVGTYPATNRSKYVAFGTADDATFDISDYYNNIFLPIVNFPINYLNNVYGNKNGFYNVYAKEVVDSIFNNFFLTETPDSLTTDYTKNKALVKRHLLDMNSTVSLYKKIADYVVPRMYSFKSSDIPATDVSVVVDDIANVFGADTNMLTIDDAAIANTKTYLLDAMTTMEDMLSACEKSQLKYFVSSNINNFLDFVVLCVKKFVSYTTNVYKTSVSFNYASLNNRIDFSENVEMHYQNEMEDHFFYDESIDFIENK
jgi:hypothetical protein